MSDIDIRESPYYKVVELIRDNYFWYLHIVPNSNPDYDDPTVRHQIHLYYVSRKYKTKFKQCGTYSGPTADDVAKQTLYALIEEYVKDRREQKEKKQDYVRELEDHVHQNYRNIVTIRQEVVERYDVGERYRVSVELRRDCEEFKTCGGDWVLAEGFGRDYQQASFRALELILFKELKEGEESKDRLWINEIANKGRNRELNFFSKSQLNAESRRMEAENITVPNFLSNGERAEPVMKRSNSVRSMTDLLRGTTGWKNVQKVRSPFSSQRTTPASSKPTTPAEEKKSVFGDSSGGSHNARNIASVLGSSRSKDLSRKKGVTPVGEGSDANEVSRKSHRREEGRARGSGGTGARPKDSRSGLRDSSTGGGKGPQAGEQEKSGGGGLMMKTLPAGRKARAGPDSTGEKSSRRDRTSTPSGRR